MSTGGVYEIINTQNGVRYVGSAKCIKTRLSQHRAMLVRDKHHSIALQRAWNKYGADVFVLRPLAVLEECEQLPTEQRLLDLEHQGETYNIARDAVAWMKGRKHTPETLAQMTISRTGNKSRAGVPSHWVGKNLSDEHCDNLSVQKSDEHKKNISKAKKGRPPTRGNLCIRGHELTGDNLYVSPKRGQRTCKICIKIRYENNQAKLKESRGYSHGIT